MDQDNSIVNSEKVLESPEADIGTRKRVMSEKGREYQVSLAESRFKAMISSWRRQSNQLATITTDSNNTSSIRNHRDKLQDTFDELSTVFENLQSVKDDYSAEAAKFEGIESDHQQCMFTVAHRIHDLDMQNQEVVSNRSFRSAISTSSKRSGSSKTSERSNASKISDANAKKAILQAKLKFIDIESKCKAQLQKVQTMKEMEMVGAEIDALGFGTFDLQEIDSEVHVDIPLIEDKSEDYVKNYVQNLGKPPCPIEVDVLVSDGKVNASEVHTSLHQSKIVPTSISIDAAHTDNQSQSNVPVLNPNTPVFVPPCSSQSSTQGTWVYNPVVGGSSISVPSVTSSTSASVSTVTSLENALPAVGKGPLQSSHSENVMVSSSVMAPGQNTPQSNSIEQGLLDLARSLADQMTINRLPPPEPSVFTGDPLSYPSWKAAFESLIEQKKIPTSERLHYLKRYVSGAVKDVIEGFFLLSTDTAYAEAKTTLDKRYGDPFVIANAFRDKLEKWPKIPPKDGTGLQKFADFLQQCSVAMQTIKSLSILNDDRENRKLLTKLPDWIVARWGRNATHWKETKGEYPPFKNFAEFIAQEAKIACDPLTSIQSLRGSSSQVFQKTGYKQDKKSFESRSFLSEANETDQKGLSVSGKTNCELCKKSHDLDQCRIFLAKSLTERKTFIKEKGLCFACLQSNHISRKCKHRKKCKVCAKFHPTSLHGDTGQETQPKQVEGSGASTSQRADEGKPPQIIQKGFAGAVSLNNQSKLSKCSAIVPVYVSHCDDPSKEILVYALLDTQSDTTFILEKTCTELGVKGTEVKLSLSTMYATDKLISSYKVKGLTVRGVREGPRISLPDTYSRNIMPANHEHIPTPDMARMWSHLEPIANYLEPLRSCEIGLLIGYNCPRALVPREVIASIEDGPYGQRTDLGWSIVGVVDHGQCENDEIGFSHRLLCREVPSLLKDEGPRATPVMFSLRTSVKEVVSNEVLSILERDFNDSAQSGTALSEQERTFLSILSQNISFKNGHYEMPLPFKGPDPCLPSNKSAALTRLKSLRRRLEKEDTFRRHYTEFMQELLRNGHAEKVPDTEMVTEVGHVWYIPHHGVYHPQKPNKIRVVFDCSAQFQGVSLNSCLLQGPDLTNKLAGVICRFRKEPVAIMCDVEKMFYQFRVSACHQDYLRFLWWENENFSTEPVEYRMKVHLFGATSSPGCSNFGFKRMAEDNRERFGPEAANFICRDFYVDDGLKSVSTVKEAIDLIDNSKEMCKGGGLRLHKFVSNVKEVIQHVQQEDRASDLKEVDIVTEKLPIERALGIHWCIESDTFQFRIVMKDHPLTRRGILSCVCSMYDPLGFIAPVVLTGKQILQNMCAENAGWDDPLSDPLRAKWERWCRSLEELKSLDVNRCVKPEDFGEAKVVEVHHFSDASCSGYGQCSYLRLVNESGQVHCSLLIGKSRVVPLKPITIPRLELSAALLSVKMGIFLDQELDYANLTHFYWTDSKVVLGYLANEARRFHVFVANRVQQIKDHTNTSQWRYVATKENPADLASRGVSAMELRNNQIWFKGPEFLWRSAITESTDEMAGLSPNDPEVKKGHCFVTEAKQNVFPSLLERISYFSDWNRARKAIAGCFRFIDILHSRSAKGSAKENSLELTRSHDLHYEPYTVDEIQRAEKAIVRIVQAESFGEEVQLLRAQECTGIPSSTGEQATRKRSLRGKSQLQKLNPFLDKNGILRVGGRIQNSQVSDMVKFPVVLPRKGHVTQLVICHFHHKTKHQGRGITTQAIRSNGFWIIGCSSAVASQIACCVECRRLRSPTQDQKMADLPEDRLEPAPPFTYCAVDLFGPWYIKEGRKELKRYGVLFTCLACRAVHVETTNSLSTDSFINCLRRFLSIRGPIRTLRSDRGTNFVGAEHELRDAVSNLMKLVSGNSFWEKTVISLVSK